MRAYLKIILVHIVIYAQITDILSFTFKSTPRSLQTTNSLFTPIHDVMRLDQLKNNNLGYSGAKKILNAASKDKDEVTITGTVKGLLKGDALSLLAGSLILFLVVGNRFNTPDLYDSQSRTDLLAVFVAGALILNGVSLADLSVREADKVELAGLEVSEASLPETFLQSIQQLKEEEQQRESTSSSLTPSAEFRWAGETILATTAARSVVFWSPTHGTLARFGVMGPQNGPGPAQAVGPILRQALEEAKKSVASSSGGGVPKHLYLPDLQILPGKIEFTYLPKACQGVLFQAFTAKNNIQGVIIIGTDQARSFNPKDILWIKQIAKRVGAVLE